MWLHILQPIYSFYADIMRYGQLLIADMNQNFWIEASIKWYELYHFKTIGRGHAQKI